MREADTPWLILLAVHKGQFLLVGGYREMEIFGRYFVRTATGSQTFSQPQIL